MAIVLRYISCMFGSLSGTEEIEVPKGAIVLKAEQVNSGLGVDSLGITVLCDEKNYDKDLTEKITLVLVKKATPFEEEINNLEYLGVYQMPDEYGGDTSYIFRKKNTENPKE